jgi:D-threo-aldose 1-dehydrogenase
MDHNRDDFIVTTKVGRVLHRPGNPATFDRSPWPGGLGFEVEFSYTYDAVMRAYEQSLMRLALDRIDALLIHDPDPMAHGDQFETRMAELENGGIRALQELKASGQIKAIGMGLNTIEALEHCANRVPLDFLIVAMPYTLLDQSALAAMDNLARRGISVIIGAPYASGILVTGPVPGARYRYQPASPEVMGKTAAIQAVCAAHGVSLPSAALHFALAHPAVVSAIPGAARPEEATATLAAYAARPPAALWASLQAQGLIVDGAPVPT